MVHKRKDESAEEFRLRCNAYLRSYRRKKWDNPTFRQTQYAKQKRARLKAKREVKQKLGNKCIICDSIKHIIYHEIHGKPHDCSNWFYTRKHIEDFVPMCQRCHIALHSLKKLEGKLEILIKLLNLISKPPPYLVRVPLHKSIKKV